MSVALGHGCACVAPADEYVTDSVAPAKATTLRPLASRVELASATMTRLRKPIMEPPLLLWQLPAHERDLMLRHVATSNATLKV
jgi:hypothetical protein